jgi:hypothetical protein
VSEISRLYSIQLKPVLVIYPDLLLPGSRLKRRKSQKQNMAIATAKPKPAVKPKVLTQKELNSFLKLHVGEATDAYLRSLATKVPAQF